MDDASHRLGSRPEENDVSHRHRKDAEAEVDSRGVGHSSARESEPEPQPVGDAVGGIVGAATGASIGAFGGPLGILLGAAAGALGGWWAGHSVSDVLGDYDDLGHRHRHVSRTGRNDYDDVRDYYRFGHLARKNPDYHGRSFNEVEEDLRRTWTADATRYGRWEDVRDYVSEGYLGDPEQQR
jgi:hypothetical protein